MKKHILTLSLLLSIAVLPNCIGSGHKNVDTHEVSEQPKKEQGPTVKTLPSGLTYEILKAAPENAATPTKGKAVTVHYTGWLADENGQAQLDKKFDSSVDRGEPFTFVLGIGHVIQGWDKGVKDMKVGEKRRLIIPAHLGYGARGAGRMIPGNATLVFDVELLKV